MFIDVVPTSQVRLWIGPRTNSELIFLLHYEMVLFNSGESDFALLWDRVVATAAGGGGMGSGEES